MSIEKDTEIKSRYEDYSVEELKEALNAIFDSTDEFSDSDVEQMDEIMAVLNRKNPLPRRYTAEESLKHFLENHSEELSRLGVRNTGEVMEEAADKPANIDADVVVPITSAGKVHSVSAASSESKRGKRSQKLIRTALIAAAVVALMVIITVSAAAAGIDIWKWVQVRGEGTVRFVTEDALSKDIPAALKQAGVEVPLFPTWIPEGFVLCEQQIMFDDPIRIHVAYVFKDKTISINIRSAVDDSLSGIIEIEEHEPQKYFSNGITHYIISNYDQIVAYWVENGYLIKISGEISIEELEHIIESIYDEV